MKGFGWIKQVGRVVAMPVTVPAKAIKKGAEKTMGALLGAAARHILTAIGLQGLLSADELQIVSGAVAILLGLGWSLVEKKIRGKFSPAQ